MRILGSVAVVALIAALAACNPPAPAPQPQPQPPAGGDGYGPFGGDMQQQQPLGAVPQQQSAEGVVSGAGGGVPPEFHTLITNYLNSYSGQMAASWPQVQGVADAITGLSPGGEHRWQVRLAGGVSYAFIGACDNECGNLDLVLEDASGAAVDSDTLADDYPLVEVTPPAPGVYTLRIQLRECSIGPCYVGARLLRSP